MSLMGLVWNEKTIINLWKFVSVCLMLLTKIAAYTLTTYIYYCTSPRDMLTDKHARIQTCEKAICLSIGYSEVVAQFVLFSFGFSTLLERLKTDDSEYIVYNFNNEVRFRKYTDLKTI